MYTNTQTQTLAHAHAWIYKCVNAYKKQCSNRYVKYILHTNLIA